MLASKGGETMPCLGTDDEKSAGRSAHWKKYQNLSPRTRKNPCFWEQNRARERRSQKLYEEHHFSHIYQRLLFIDCRMGEPRREECLTTEKGRVTIDLCTNFHRQRCREQEESHPRKKTSNTTLFSETKGQSDEMWVCGMWRRKSTKRERESKDQ